MKRLLSIVAALIIALWCMPLAMAQDAAGETTTPADETTTVDATDATTTVDADAGDSETTPEADATTTADADTTPAADMTANLDVDTTTAAADATTTADCGECPVYEPLAPDSCAEGQVVVPGDLDACGCAGAPQCGTAADATADTDTQDDADAAADTDATDADVEPIPGVATDQDVADAGITPDSPLYGLELFFEKFDEKITLGKSAKAKKGLVHARERLMEVKTMIAERKMAKAGVAQEELEQDMADVETSVEQLGDGASEEELAVELELEAGIEEQKADLADLADKEEEIAAELGEEGAAQLSEVVDAVQDATVSAEATVSDKKGKTKVKLSAELGLTDAQVDELEANIKKNGKTAVKEVKAQKEQVAKESKGKKTTDSAGSDTKGNSKKTADTTASDDSTNGKSDKGNSKKTADTTASDDSTNGKSDKSTNGGKGKKN